MRYLCLFMLMIPVGIMAQVWEDFSDEELGSGPEWLGQTAKFKFSSSSAVPEAQRPALQLNGSGSDSAWISFDQGNFAEMQWEFWVKLSFNSSASNFARIFLGSEEEDLSAPGVAYFVQLGGADDSVWFGKTGAAGTQVLYCFPGWSAGNSTNSFRVKVIRDADGEWHFMGDAGGGYLLQDLGSCTVPGEIPGLFSGIYCHFTSSNATKMYFDDLYCGPQIVDSLPPEILQVKVIPPNEVLVVFNEPVSPESAADTTHYLVSDGIGHPAQLILLENQDTVKLIFSEEILEGKNYFLNINNIEDLNGNRMEEYSGGLMYYFPEPYDVIINEVMADPTPPVDLPEFEYVELFNRSAYPIDLTGWELNIGGSSRIFPVSGIPPSGYLLLVDEAYIPGYTQFGAVTGLSSLSIGNEGAAISLYDTAGMLICHTEYDPANYGGGVKAEGGWALERREPERPCDDRNGWAAATDPSGGTPGRENSVPAGEQAPLALERLCCTDSSSLLLTFSQGLDAQSLQNVSLYSADHGLGNPLSALAADETSSQVLLVFPETILNGTTYRLEIQASLADCDGNPLEYATDGYFSQPSACAPFDVIFNEILFNPLTAGAEYLELYNRSDKTIHLDELLLAQIRESPPNPPDTAFYPLSEECCPFYPGEYVVLTKYPEKVGNSYYTPDPSALLAMDPFPVLANESGKLRLTGLSHTTIDGLDYSQEMQYPLLNTFSGISLERVSPEASGMSPGNWHSASSGCGYGTPGYRNSQYSEEVAAAGFLEVDPVAFTPNGDGRDDVLGILSRFDTPGMLLTALIFAEDGRLIRHLAQGYLAGTENRFSWDGLDDSGRRAPEGVYVVFLEALGQDGTTGTFKKAAILAYGN